MPAIRLQQKGPFPLCHDQIILHDMNLMPHKWMLDQIYIDYIIMRNILIYCIWYSYYAIYYFDWLIIHCHIYIAYLYPLWSIYYVAYIVCIFVKLDKFQGSFLGDVFEKSLARISVSLGYGWMIDLHNWNKKYYSYWSCFGFYVYSEGSILKVKHTYTSLSRTRFVVSFLYLGGNSPCCNTTNRSSPQIFLREHTSMVLVINKINHWKRIGHCSDVTMGAMASQITSLTIVYSTVYSRRRSTKISKFRVTGLCAGNSLLTGALSTQGAINVENVFIWRHYGIITIPWMILQSKALSFIFNKSR